MPTTSAQWQFLTLCGAVIFGGLGLIAVGHYLMPVRALRHAWRNRH